MAGFTGTIKWKKGEKGAVVGFWWIAPPNAQVRVLRNMSEAMQHPMSQKKLAVCQIEWLGVIESLQYPNEARFALGGATSAEEGLGFWFSVVLLGISHCRLHGSVRFTSI